MVQTILGSWMDNPCGDIDGTVHQTRGFPCETPPQYMMLQRLLQFVEQSKEKNLWATALEERWTKGSLQNECPDQRLIFKLLGSDLIATRMKVRTSNEEDLLLAFDIYALLQICPPDHVVEAARLGAFYQDLFDTHNLRTVAFATMNNMRNGLNIQSIDLVRELFGRLDQVFNFSIGPLVVALSTYDQIEQLQNQSLPFLNTEEFVKHKNYSNGDRSLGK